MLEPVGARTGAAGVADPFFPRHHFEHGSRKLATSVPMIDLEGQGVSTRLPFGHPLQGNDCRMIAPIEMSAIQSACMPAPVSAS